ncbi:MAG: RidA family protein [Candidatus Fonsibacter sp.]|nr:RidA family protein [Candidatus Fonsibacter sp.]
MSKIEEILKKINITIPNPPKPVGNYATFSRHEKLIFVSGQLPVTSDGKIITGKVIKEISLKQAQKAAEISILNALGQLKIACNGNLDHVKSCIRISGYVNCLDNFSDHAKVINGASDLITKIFTVNLHSRIAIGCNSLPLNACVEIESIFETN